LHGDYKRIVNVGGSALLGAEQGKCLLSRFDRIANVRCRAGSVPAAKRSRELLASECIVEHFAGGAAAGKAVDRSFLQQNNARYIRQ
jgi:hypothetical protein